MTALLIVLAFLIYIIPTFMGAGYDNVHLWYLNKINKLIDVDDLVDDDELKVWKVKTNEVVKSMKSFGDNTKPKARKSFKQATTKALNTIDVLKNADVVKLKQKKRKKVVTDKFGLTYLNVPEKISANNVVVLNANELIVGKNRIFLH